MELRRVPTETIFTMITLTSRILSTLTLGGIFFLPHFSSAAGEAPPSPSALPPLRYTLDAASARTDGEHLIVSTGAVERIWRLTPAGLATVSIKNLRTGTAWEVPSRAQADWEYPGWIDKDARVNTVRVEAGPADDDGFTSRHLRVLVDLEYPGQDASLRMEVWAYPGAEGLRTQLWAKGKSIADAKAPSRPTFEILNATADDGQLAGTYNPDILLRLAGMKPGVAYQFELEWKPGQGANHSAQVQSLDGEASGLLLKASGDTLLLPIDPALSPDGSVRLRINRPNNLGGTRLVAARLLEVGKTEPEAVVGLSTLTSPDAAHPPRRADFVPATFTRARAVGFYNDTQKRQRPEHRLFREKDFTGGTVDWASLLFLEKDNAGLILVKESHKCANRSGVDTGAFAAGPSGVEVTGWGLSRADLDPSEWRWAWANWVVVHTAGPAHTAEAALKRFDRIRYPQRPALDLYTKANTWGSGGSQQESFDRASEEEVLAEIDSVADLGLDSLQIDDGWQVGRMPSKRGNFANPDQWLPRPDWYPVGWSRVVERAKERGIRLCVWFAMAAPYEALKRAYDEAGFKTWKLDFASFGNYSETVAGLEKARALIRHSGHTVRVNWDVTENPPRYGYFWARECGNVWLANRKPSSPPTIPWFMLRQHWDAVRFLNGTSYELPVQNFRRITTPKSDATLYSDDYALAIALPGIPVFFQTTRLLEPDQRATTRRLLEPYKRARGELFTLTCFPIGSVPDNKSWTGFQWNDPAAPGSGYLLIFRERENTEPTGKVELAFLRNMNLAATNLVTGSKTEHRIDAQGVATFDLPEGGSYLFLSYQTKQ